MTILHPAWMDWPETATLVKAFAAQKTEMRFVGGAVRDALLNRSVTDVDAATPLHPDAVMSLLEKAGIKAVPTGIAHGTVTAVIDKKSFEITTLRKDTSCDGRHAAVEFTADWNEDAKRRDFTMNALYLSPAGDVYDYFDGEKDAKAGCVRFIGKPEDRIKEDTLRILRFFRFHAHYGRGAPDAAALAACTALSAQIDKLSGERIRHELLKLLSALHYSDTIAVMQAKKILAPALGFAVGDVRVFARFEALENMYGQSVEPFVKLAGFLLEDELDTLSGRLKLSGQVSKDLRTVLQHYKNIKTGMTEAEQKRLLRKLGPDNFRRSVQVGWAAGAEAIAPASPYNPMLALAMRWTPPEFTFGGRDLEAIGMLEGKRIGEILRALEQEWEASDYRLTRDQLLARAKALL